MDTTEDQDDQIELYNITEEDNLQEEMQEESKFFIIETVFIREDEVSKQEYAGGLFAMVQQLLYDWTKEKAIEDAYDCDNQLINHNYEDYEEWTTEPKVVMRKKQVKVETIIHVKTSFKAHGLYMNQKEFCDSNEIRIIKKNTGLEYTKKIGFLSGTYVKLASQDRYSKEITMEMKLQENTLDIRKEYTYERGHRSKVLAIYAVQDEAKEVDEILYNLKSPRYSYISYRQTTSDERLTAIYTNDRHNIKARYETLYDVSLNDEV